MHRNRAVAKRSWQILHLPLGDLTSDLSSEKSLTLRSKGVPASPFTSHSNGKFRSRPLDCLGPRAHLRLRAQTITFGVPSSGRVILSASAVLKFRV